MKAEEIIEKIKLIEDKYDRIYELSSDKNKETFGEVKLVNNEGNTEGGGEYSEKVYFFKDHNVYLKVTGCYTSYNGCDWNDDWTEVKPIEKTITVYE